MDTIELFKKIYSTADIKRFKKTMIKYFKGNNYKEVKYNERIEDDEAFKIGILHDGFSRTMQRVTFTWRTKDNWYIMCLRTICSHYLFIESGNKLHDDKENRFYEYKKNGVYYKEEESIDSTKLLEFINANTALIEALEKEYFN